MQPGVNTFVFPVSHMRGERSYVKELQAILRKQLTWVVLVCYTLMLLKPALPVFADVVAHAFYEDQHMLTVHEVNGVFHVHNDVVKNSHQADKDKPGTNNKMETEEYIALKNVTLYSSSFLQHTMLSFCVYRCFYCFPYRTTPTPPPNV